MIHIPFLFDFFDGAFLCGFFRGGGLFLDLVSNSSKSESESESSLCSSSLDEPRFRFAEIIQV